MNDQALAFLDDTIARARRMWGVTHPRGIGAFSSFRSQLPFDRLPEWRELRALARSRSNGAGSATRMSSHGS